MSQLTKALSRCSTWPASGPARRLRDVAGRRRRSCCRQCGMQVRMRTTRARGESQRASEREMDENKSSSPNCGHVSSGCAFERRNELCVRFILDHPTLSSPPSLASPRSLTLFIFTTAKAPTLLCSPQRRKISMQAFFSAHSPHLKQRQCAAQIQAEHPASPFSPSPPTLKPPSSPPQLYR